MRFSYFFLVFFGTETNDLAPSCIQVLFYTKIGVVKRSMGSRVLSWLYCCNTELMMRKQNATFSSELVSVCYIYYGDSIREQMANELQSNSVIPQPKREEHEGILMWVGTLVADASP